ncbi:homoserine dehydrogenase [Candidatus Latescibacterota bacterium]
MKSSVKVGLIGFGTVGTGVAKLLLGKNKPYLSGKNFDLELVKIVDLDITTDRGIDIPGNLLTINVDDVLDNPDIGIVVELIGGYEPARSFTLKAFKNGKSVVTANKALIAKHGTELFEAADKAGVSYLFEASVGGGIPILRGLADGLNANNIESISGILNGTTNYILTGMSRDGTDYGDVLETAQELGYAEADPTSDVSGGDALNKIAILARLAYGAVIDIDDIYCEGIEQISVQDIDYAAELGFAIKLLAIAKRRDGNRVEVRVHPTLVPTDSIMAYVEDEFNAIEVYGDAVGREVFYGKGAGMMPTASAVISDTVNIAGSLACGNPTPVRWIVPTNGGPELVNIEEVCLRYYLRFTVKDQAGVLARISRIFADAEISIESVIQIGTSDNDCVPLVIMTHEALEGNMQKAMRLFEQLDIFESRIQLIRVEEI